MPLRFPLPALLAAAVAAACGPQAAPPAAATPVVDSASVLAATQGWWDGWVKAAMAGNFAALQAMVTDSFALDAKGMPPMVGKAAFVAGFEPAFNAMKVNHEAITVESTTPVTNELAYQTGDFVETTTVAGKTQTEYGRFAAALRKDADGVWRLGYIMAFPDSTVPAKP
jgi:ketosteroid isomerase-like protein